MISPKRSILKGNFFSGVRWMVFSSLVFLYAYLPLTLLAVFLSPRRWQNLVLLVASLLFYGWGEPLYILLMIATFTAAYLFGFPIARNRSSHPARARLWTILSASVSLSALFFFKYYDFTAATLSRLPFRNIPLLGLRLPIGISFYTFQILSYTVDLYRGDADLQRNYVSFGAYVALFPQLIAGPIVRYREIDGQLRDRRTTAADFSAGVERFCVGLSKKVLLGDPLASGYVYFRDAVSLDPSALGAWMSVILYSLHLYFDFSGYSDMAIGLGRMLGFRFPENFDYPYTAGSIREFWRRWHLTLSGWFRTYVYIPLGGNRKGRRKQLRNLAAVWLLTGLWHGANWNFILWGCYYFVLLAAEHFLLRDRLDGIPLPLRRAGTLLLVFLGFLLFSEPDLPTVGHTLRALVSFGCPIALPTDLYRLLTLLPLLALAAIGSTPLPRRWFACLTDRHPRARWLRPALCGFALLLSTAYLADSSFSPFEYLNF